MSNTGSCVGGALDGETLESDDTTFPQYHFADLAELWDGLPQRTLLGTYTFDGTSRNWTTP